MTSPFIVACILLAGLQVCPAVARSLVCPDADVFFVLDSSSSIHTDDFKKQLQFVERVTEQFQESWKFGVRVRVGILTFSDNVRHHIALGQYTDKAAFHRAVAGIQQKIGQTNTHKALLSMMDEGFGKPRAGVPHIGIVITDGRSSEADQTPIAARKVKDAGYTMFGIGVGPNVDYGELYTIASQPSDQHVFLVGSYQALKSIENKLAEGVCPTPTPAPTEPPLTPVDVVFSLPQQAGVQETRDYIDFVQEVSRHASIPDEVKMGLAKQIYDTRDEIPLEDSPSGEYLRQRLEGEKPKGDRTERVLLRMRTSSLLPHQGARRDSVKMAILIEDYKMASPSATRYQAEEAKKRGIHIVVISVGPNTEPQELRRIASAPSDYFQLSNSTQLIERAFLRKIDTIINNASEGKLPKEGFLPLF